jgi:hypothetical protein
MIVLDGRQRCFPEVKPQRESWGEEKAHWPLMHYAAKHCNGLSPVGCTARTVNKEIILASTRLVTGANLENLLAGLRKLTVYAQNSTSYCIPTSGHGTFVK